MAALSADGTGQGSSNIQSVFPQTIFELERLSAKAINYLPNIGVVVGTGLLSTDAIGGFFYVPSCYGVPSGTPNNVIGTSPITIDTDNNGFYFYSDGWNLVGSSESGSNVIYTSNFGYSIQLDYWDTNGQGGLTEDGLTVIASDPSSIIDLDLDNLDDATDFDGTFAFDAMPNLIYFSLAANLPTSIDFSGSSSIQEINLESMTNLTSIIAPSSLIEINIDSCPAFESLTIHQDNLEQVNLDSLSSITEVNLEDCTSLIFFESYQCPFTVLNLVNTPSLEELIAVDSMLTDSNLGSSTLIYLDLTNAPIEELTLFAPNLLVLIFNGCTSLSNFFSVEDYPLLEVFQIEGCNFNQAEVDQFLAELDNSGVMNGYANLQVDNAFPSEQGFNSVSNLQGKGWSVYVNPD